MMAVPLSLGLVLLIVAWLGRESGWLMAEQDHLFVLVIAFLLLVVASALLFLGRRLVWSAAFPLFLLLFAAPVPMAVERAIEIFFQHASAGAASALFSISGTPVLREGLAFRLPGIALEVARECSGIRSSLVLFITSLVAGFLFLRRPWQRVALALFIVPLGIVRNAVRIFTIGMLCVHVGPGMIDSWVHRKGGPLFFALSLVPFFLCLLAMRRVDAYLHPAHEPWSKSSSQPLSIGKVHGGGACASGRTEAPDNPSSKPLS
jgi:exosortase C (VPDSG-CTERM-specific)